MTHRTLLSLAVSAACIAGGALVAAVGVAGPENIRFPEGFEKGVLYATVDRHDIKQYRELYSTPEAVKAVREGKPIPHGTVLTLVQYGAKKDEKGNPVKDAKGRFVKGDLIAYTVMEKRQGWGAGYPAEWRNGDWEYAAFTKDHKPNAKANTNIRNCFVCHKPHEGQDFVISLASLSGTALGAARRPSGPGTAWKDGNSGGASGRRSTGPAGRSSAVAVNGRRGSPPASAGGIQRARSVGWPIRSRRLPPRTVTR